MTASSLRLVPLRANCVARAGKGLLVFGAHKSGKTTASYLATKRGLQFYADDGVLAEIRAGRVCVWRSFWAPMFRPETLQFLPELQSCTRPLYYRDSVFHHLSTHRLEAGQTQAIVPVCSVFLERHAAGAARLSQLDFAELCRLLAENVLFKEDKKFSHQYASVLAGMVNLPAYRLAYESDPTTAATFFEDMLLNHHAFC